MQHEVSMVKIEQDLVIRREYNHIDRGLTRLQEGSSLTGMYGLQSPEMRVATLALFVLGLNSGEREVSRTAIDVLTFLASDPKYILDWGARSKLTAEMLALCIDADDAELQEACEFLRQKRRAKLAQEDNHDE